MPEENLNGSTRDNEGEGSEDQVKMVSIVVDGETKEIPETELVKAYQTDQASAKRFQEAADIKKGAETAIGLQTAFNTLKENPGDEGAFRVVANAQGWDDEKIKGALAEYRKQQIREAVSELDDESGEEEGDESPGDKGGGAVPVGELAVKVAELLGPHFTKAAAASKIGVANLEPKLRDLIVQMGNRYMTGNFQSGVDNDKILGNLMKAGSDGQKKAVHQMIREEAKRRVDAGQDPNSPEVQAKVLEEVRDRIVALGITPAKAPVPPGLGSSGSGSVALHQNEKPMDRPKGGMMALEYEEYLQDKIARAFAGAPT